VHGAAAPPHFAVQRRPDRAQIVPSLRKPTDRQIGHGEEGVRIDCNHFGEAVGHGGGCSLPSKIAVLAGASCFSLGWARTSAKSRKPYRKSLRWRRGAIVREHNLRMREAAGSQYRYQ